MKEKEHQKGIKAYEPITKVLTLKVLTDKPVSKIEDVPEDNKKTENFLERIWRRFFSKKEETTAGREYRTIRISFISSSAEMIFRYFKLSIAESSQFWNHLELMKTEVLTQDLAELVKSVENLYFTVLQDSLSRVAYSDEVMYLVLNLEKGSEGDFVPFLTLEQKRLILETFIEVNPIIDETEKKARATTLEMKAMTEQLKKTLEEIENMKTETPLDPDIEAMKKSVESLKALSADSSS